MKKVKIFLKISTKNGRLVLNYIGSKFKVFLKILNLFMGLLWPYICLAMAFAIPNKKGSGFLTGILCMIIYVCVLYGYFRITYLEKELSHCRNCCRVNIFGDFGQVFAKIISVEKELVDLDFESDMATIEKGVWQKALEMLPSESEELRKKFQDKIDECEKFIDEECDE